VFEVVVGILVDSVIVLAVTFSVFVEVSVVVVVVASDRLVSTSIKIIVFFIVVGILVDSVIVVAVKFSVFVDVTVVLVSDGLVSILLEVVEAII
jgi:hypothetical protein